jgi:uncharacterized protein YwqG
LGFVAQVDLAQVRPFDLEHDLPADGLLSFFYDSVEQSAWGFDPADRDKFAVSYTPAGTPLIRRTPPHELAAEARFAAVGLTPSAEWSLPAWESHDVSQLGLSRDELFRYGELVDDDEDSTIHRLLGHPEPVQGDMQVECQLASNGIYCGDGSSYQNPRVRELEPGAAEWRLLFQLDTEDQIDLMWGDVGRIYYWIRDRDLRQQNWDATWLVLQCG